MKKDDWDHFTQYANKHWIGKNVAVCYAYVKQTCYYCKHRETRYKEVTGILKKITENAVYLEGGVLTDIKRHKNRILYVKLNGGR